MCTYDPVGVAFVGCGNISGRYGDQLAAHSDKLNLVGAYDIIPERTAAFAERFGCKAYQSMEELLADEAVEAGLNITTHTAHTDVTAALLNGGKHVHSEKPVGTDRDSVAACIALASDRNLHFSCSPIVILGESQQTLKRLLAENTIGQVREIYAEMNHGRIETWHPDPEAFYGFGAGPLLDVGCYPLSVLIQLIGPVRSVQAMGGVRLPRRTIGSGPKAGQTYTVTNPDHTVALLTFDNGVHCRLTTTFFAVKSAQGGGIEFHGTEGSLWTQSSAAFNSALKLCRPGDREWTEIPPDKEPYPGVDYARGLAELADAIRLGTPLTCPAQAAEHVLDISLCALEAAATGVGVTVQSRYCS